MTHQILLLLLLETGNWPPSEINLLIELWEPKASALNQPNNTCMLQEITKLLDKDKSVEQVTAKVSWCNVRCSIYRWSFYLSIYEIRILTPGCAPTCQVQVQTLLRDSRTDYSNCYKLRKELKYCVKKCAVYVMFHIVCLSQYFSVSDCQS